MYSVSSQIWILATVLYGILLGLALLFSPQNSQHKITQNRVCGAFWWVFEWFSVIVITLGHVGHIFLRWNPIYSRSELASSDPSYRLHGHLSTKQRTPWPTPRVCSLQSVKVTIFLENSSFFTILKSPDWWFVSYFFRQLFGMIEKIPLVTV